MTQDSNVSTIRSPAELQLLCALKSLIQTSGHAGCGPRAAQRACAKHSGGPTFVQCSEALGAHGEVGGEPQGEDGPRADDGGGQLKSRQPEFKKTHKDR